MTAASEHYRDVLADAGIDDESLTVLVATGSSRDQVADVLGIDLATEASDEDDGDIETTGWAITTIPRGVLALEHSGYGDPTLDALRQLSVGGGSAAVVRRNIQAHHRFGYARDGQVVFDDDDYPYLEDRRRVPAEITPLLTGVWAWVDAEGDPEPDGEGELPGVDVGLAMAEVVTGLTSTAGDLRAASDSGYWSGPSLVYAFED